MTYEMAVLPNAQAAYLKTLRGVASVLGMHHHVLHGFREAMPTLSVPTLVVWGRQDRVLPVSHARATRAIPGARVEILDNCGHLPPLEHPDPFNRIVLDFMSDVGDRESAA